MTDATRSAIIKEKPIAHGLHAFRDSAQSLSQGLDASTSTGVLGRIDDESLQDHALDLLSALQILPASRSLPSGTGGKNLFSDLSRLNLAVNSGDFDVRRIILPGVRYRNIHPACRCRCPCPAAAALPAHGLPLKQPGVSCRTLHLAR
ncbi:hypothetical protein BDW02DRAFT_567708 [Decorospora gaudefroyi]|uniref:Uncharacterized protein n=1 Tax=Decorospora gaudefroyi TaxID=184978 RepID=A0A6A5KPX6_9PLEO|nr:hypothetical protein BDW02DRAFT_567708 [Decorospora gaudefroyi]